MKNLLFLVCICVYASRNSANAVSLTRLYYEPQKVAERTSVGLKAEQCLDGLYPPPKNLSVGWAEVNLDLPPKQRWNNVVKHKKQAIVGLIGQFKKFIVNIFHSQYLIHLVDNDLPSLVNTLPQPFQDELKGMAEATGIKLGEIALYNIFYEIFTVCTSVIAEDSTGKLFHVRNLDFGLFMGINFTTDQWLITTFLRPAIVNLNFTKGGKTVFKSTNFAGYVGILTAMKPGVFTLTMNERFNIDGGFIGIFDWIINKRNGHWMGFLTRNVMEQAKSYSEAVASLSNEPMLAPAYFIVAGNRSGEACVITRSREKAVDVWQMKTKTNPWYILETNYDHWKAPLFIDNRRDPGNKCMIQKGQKSMGFSALFNMLSSKPVLNKLTTYSALMQVNSGAFESYLQYCPNPCPWF